METESDRSRKKAVYVGELIELLKKFPADAVVLTEGCDCSGWAGGAELVNLQWQNRDGVEVPTVMITRA